MSKKEEKKRIKELIKNKGWEYKEDGSEIYHRYWYRHIKIKNRKFTFQMWIFNHFPKIYYKLYKNKRTIAELF